MPASCELRAGSWPPAALALLNKLAPCVCIPNKCPSAEAHRDNLAPSYCWEPCLSGLSGPVGGGDSRRARGWGWMCASLPHRTTTSFAQMVW